MVMTWRKFIIQEHVADINIITELKLCVDHVAKKFHRMIKKYMIV